MAPPITPESLSHYHFWVPLWPGRERTKDSIVQSLGCWSSFEYQPWTSIGVGTEPLGLLASSQSKPLWKHQGVRNGLHLEVLLLLRSAQFQWEESWSPVSQRRMTRRKFCPSKNEEHLSDHKHPKGRCIVQSLKRRPLRKMLSNILSIQEKA